MTRAPRHEFLLLQIVGDLLAVVSGLLLGYWLRFGAGIIPPAGGWNPDDYVRQLPWAAGLWMLALYLTGNHVNHPRVISFNRARRLLMGSALAIVLLVTKNYFARDEDLARILYPMLLGVVTVALVVERVALQGVVLWLLRHQQIPRSRVLIVGLGQTAYRLAARIRQHPEYAFELAGFVCKDGRAVGRRIGGVPVLGSVANMREVLRTSNVQDVFLAETDLPRESLLDLFLEREMSSLRVHVVPSLVEMMRSRISYDEVAGLPLYHVTESPLGGMNATMKRLFDIGVSVPALALLGLPMLVMGWLVRRSSPGPALFRQQRVGLDGRPFVMLKYRTMPVNAEADGPAWGAQDDPRATRLGRFLRRTNLDELPQLLNVLKGEMSLVGPRPERPHFVQLFEEQFPFYTTRHKVRAGMTGWAQVHGLRGNTSIPQRLRYDLYYIDNWSLWLDIKILMLTLSRRRRRPRRTNPPVPMPNAAGTTPPKDSEAPCASPKTSGLSATKQPG